MGRLLSEDEQGCLSLWDGEREHRMREQAGGGGGRGGFELEAY